ncbi:hypothetical protein HUJ04_011646, partial [Dendroctonus ponderosae]
RNEVERKGEYHVEWSTTRTELTLRSGDTDTPKRNGEERKGDIQWSTTRTELTLSSGDTDTPKGNATDENRRQNWKSFANVAAKKCFIGSYHLSSDKTTYLLPKEKIKLNHRDVRMSNTWTERTQSGAAFSDAGGYHSVEAEYQ